MGLHYTIHADGASRGNPGPAAGGAVALETESGRLALELAVLVGVASNNVAEYRGMIAAVRAVREHLDPSAVTIKMDSKLVVEQMSGRWKVKHPDMRDLVKEAWSVIDTLPVEFLWIPREDNHLADRMGNLALDQGTDHFRLH